TDEPGGVFVARALDGKVASFGTLAPSSRLPRAGPADPRPPVASEGAANRPAQGGANQTSRRPPAGDGKQPPHDPSGLQAALAYLVGHLTHPGLRPCLPSPSRALNPLSFAGGRSRQAWR